jgi:hypothetical protein
LESIGTPPPVLITPPCMPSEHFVGRNKADVGYFGSKKVVEDVNVAAVRPGGRSAVGVIGQGFAPSLIPSAGGSAYGIVVRQPHGPPGGADELGNKNFASR